MLVIKVEPTPQITDEASHIQAAIITAKSIIRNVDLNDADSLCEAHKAMWDWVICSLHEVCALGRDYSEDPRGDTAFDSYDIGDGVEYLRQQFIEKTGFLLWYLVRRDYLK